MASFFSGFDASNLNVLLSDFDYSYAEDLILLLERHRVAKKVGSQVLFDSLVEARMPLAIMLSDHHFVKRYARRLRDELLADPRNGAVPPSATTTTTEHRWYPSQ